MSTERELACEEYLDSLRGQMGEGQLALEALQLYRASGLPVPEWAFLAIESAYSDFKTGAPDEGWKQATKYAAAPRTLGEAFGIADIKGKHMEARRERAMMEPIVLRLFADKRFPRTDDGFAAAADALFLSVKQVKTWVKGHRF